jgi:hypothetical protein
LWIEPGALVRAGRLTDLSSVVSPGQQHDGCQGARGRGHGQLPSATARTGLAPAPARMVRRKRQLPGHACLGARRAEPTRNLCRLCHGLGRSARAPTPTVTCAPAWQATETNQLPTDRPTDRPAAPLPLPPGGGGRPQHRDPRNFAVEGAEPPKRCEVRPPRPRHCVCSAFAVVRQAARIVGRPPEQRRHRCRVLAPPIAPVSLRQRR